MKMIRILLGLPALVFLLVGTLFMQTLMLCVGVVVYPIMLSYGFWVEDVSGYMEATNEFIFFPIQMLKDGWRI